MSLINRAACKAHLLDLSSRHRAGRFTRVSSNVYPMLEAALRKTMLDFVRTHPTMGVTLSTGEPTTHVNPVIREEDQPQQAG